MTISALKVSIADLAEDPLAPRSPAVLTDILAGLPAGAHVVDYGCDSWPVYRALQAMGRSDILVTGADLHPPAGIPEGCRFAQVSQGQRCSLDDHVADLIVCAHVIEHAAEPLLLFGDLVRIAKPGALVYVEAPSDRAAMKQSSSDVTDHLFLSFWDDPTHRRPFPPAALYRTALSYGACPLVCGYGHGDDSIAILVARTSEDPERSKLFRYVSLRDVPPGVQAAMLAFGATRRP